MSLQQLIVAPSGDWARAAAAHIAAGIEAALAVSANARCCVALAGGNTPGPVYAQLARAYANRIDWPRVELFLSDERMVPLDHPESNYLGAKRALLDPLRDRAPRLHAVAADWEPEHAAAAYELAIRETVPAGTSALPTFDLVILGAGADGHTASLFPGTPLLSEWTRLVAATEHPRSQQPRVSFTPALLSAASETVFLVAGADKADILSRLYRAAPTPALPATVIASAAQSCTWIVDEPAAAKLPSR